MTMIRKRKTDRLASKLTQFLKEQRSHIYGEFSLSFSSKPPPRCPAPSLKLNHRLLQQGTGTADHLMLLRLLSVALLTVHFICPSTLLQLSPLIPLPPRSLLPLLLPLLLLLSEQLPPFRPFRLLPLPLLCRALALMVSAKSSLKKKISDAR